MKHVKLIFSILVNFLVVSDLVSSLFLSKTSATNEVDKSFVVVCKDDKFGKGVTWKGPDGRTLNENTHPRLQVKPYGYTLLFEKIRKEDQGIYTCVCDGTKEEGQFTLNVGDERYENNHRIPNYRGPDMTQPEEEEPTDMLEGDGESDANENENTESVTHFPIRYPPVNNRIVNDEEQLEFIRTPNEARMKEGDTDTMRCEGKGGKLLWFVNGHEPNSDKFEVGGDGLIIKNVTREDGDVEYVCKLVSENSGTFKDRKIKLIVLRKPRVAENYEKLRFAFGIPGQHLNLTCEADSEPPPSFSWSAISKRRRAFQEIIENSTTGLRSIYQLYMNNNAPDEYTCAAQNEFGSVKIHYKVEFGEKPDPPKSFQTLEVFGDRMTFEIIPPDNTSNLSEPFKPTGVQIQYRVYDNETDEEETSGNKQRDGRIRHGWACCWQDFEFSEDNTYTLVGLKPETVYEIQVAIRNIAGVSDFLNATTVQTASGTSSLKNVWFGTFVLSISTILMNVRWSGLVPYL